MAASAPLSGNSFAELDVVLLRSAAFTDQGSLPIGALGTIVFRHIHGEAYEVEFTEPVAAVLTLRPADFVSAT